GRVAGGTGSAAEIPRAGPRWPAPARPRAPQATSPRPLRPPAHDAGSAAHSGTSPFLPCWPCAEVIAISQQVETARPPPSAERDGRGHAFGRYPAAHGAGALFRARWNLDEVGDLLLGQ